MRSIVAFTLTAFAAFASGVSARPTGAPRCAVNETAIAAGHGNPSTPTLGYSIQVSGPVTPGQPVEFTIANSAGKTDFNGLLIYVTGQNKQLRLGKFLNIDQANFKPQTEICRNANFQGDAEAVLTHTNAAPKPLTTKLQWQMLPEDAARDPGPYEIISAVVINPREWQVLPPVALQVAGGAPAAPAAAPAGAPPTMGRKILKCRPKKMAAAAAMPMPASMPASMPSSHQQAAPSSHQQMGQQQQQQQNKNPYSLQPSYPSA
ncbi:hypothetical protein HK102_002088 [Quaeritorhiza haematococci]|nr:hypothetical protein HK102_002088 [Quaeritorhiza haematococci]